MSSREPQEANIAVVVRVRPRNQKEIRENSPVTVTTNGTRGKELHVKTNLAEATTKTYSFDRVFGPDADQELVFQDVVSPMLKEVLMGYNCTIFAYGQTGAGKTYTMEGDLTSIKGEHAGMIPRTLCSLFQTLEAGDSSEYSVRVSLTELYNEELKDLLTPGEEPKKLRIFDDYNKKGSVVIQGLEEVLVKDAADVIAVLQRGSNKRQTAATKMNEVSSRSHSIFCITVHIKETTPEGEELVKIGKLNLVDLAGSENIGRSGAENRRAKEAGMINQSLLTLGRVINALVDRSLHVPYRESKLTRLLQDSLGGKTKTCIIAAVSPAKCNIDETMSSLDYAHRAKNIRNKPEVNQRMTKRALLRDYEDQIHRLKADLLAAQNKSGCFMTKETYDELHTENATNKEKIDQLSKTIFANEEAYKHLKSELKQKLELLDHTKAERDRTAAELEQRSQELEERFEELRKIQQSLTEQKILTGAHADVEKRLNKLAAGLVDTLKTSISDVEGLHEKLERKSAIETENLKTFRDFQDRLLEQMSELNTQLSGFEETSSIFCRDICHDWDQFSDANCTILSEQQETMSAQFAAVFNRADALASGLCEMDSTLRQQLAGIASLARSLKASITEREAKSKSVYNDLLTSHKDLVVQHQKQLGEWNVSIRNKIASIVGDVRAYVEGESQRSQRVQQVIEESMQREMDSLRRQNQMLQQQLLEERQKAAKATDSLMDNISQLVSAYQTERDTSLQAVAEAHDEATEGHVDSLSTFLRTTQSACSESSSNRAVFINTLSAGIEQLDKEVQSEAESTDVTIKGFIEQCSIIETSVNDGVGATTASVIDCLKDVEGRQQEVLKVVDNQKEKQDEMMNSVRQGTTDIFKSTDRTLASTRDSINSHAASCRGKCTEHADAISALQIGLRDQVNRARDEISCNKLVEDAPTGQTPRKKAFNYTTTWPVTRDHDDILREYRENGRIVSPTFMSRSYQDALRIDEALSDKENEEAGYKEAKDPPYTPKGSKLPRTKSRLGLRRTLDSVGNENVQDA